MGATMVFCPVVQKVGDAWPLVEPELCLCNSASEPVESHVHWLGHLWLNYGLTAPLDVKLSVWMEVSDCRCPICARMFLMYTASLALMNSPPKSASAAEDITALIICATL